MRPLVVTVAVLLAAVVIGLGIRQAVHHRGAAGGAPAAGSSTTTSVGGDGSTGPEIVPGSGQTFLTGTVVSMSADNAVGAPLRPPFTITIAVRGQGNADITGVSVAGQNVEIFWYGGQPLPVTGTGELAIDGGPVTVDGSGITWRLDGAARSLTSGHFILGAPVAVGASGLATPHQSIAFDAGDRSTIVTAGHAQVHLPPAAIHLSGPGSVTFHGDFLMQTGAATSSRVGTVTFGPGSYSVDLTPTASGDTIRATLQGPVTSS